MSEPSARRHDIDALRVIAFASLIFFHVGMYYVADWGWHLKSVHVAHWLQLPMTLLNRWRMELLFLISGVALSLLRRGGGSAGRLAANRSARLLLPLAFGMAVVVPIQPYCQGLDRHAIEPGFWSFLLRYWSGRGFPKNAFDGWQFGWTWNHLWYLFYLWSYTMLLLPMAALLAGDRGRRARRALLSMRGTALLWLPALPFVAMSWLLQSRFGETHDFIHEGFMHPVYFTIFAFGYLIGSDAGLWQELARLRVTSLRWAILLFAAYYACLTMAGDDLAEWQLGAIRTLRWSYMWIAICTALGWSHALLNRPFRWLPYASEAVFPWYVLHQSLIVALAFWLAPLRLGPVIEPLLLIAGTIAGCALLHHFVIRPVRWLRPLFGLKPLARPAAPQAVASMLQA